ncbi:relaxase MobL [Brevibacillus humidisoli]|uniref:MobP3 family relaxase n=1 Tax=Brevibacillus humidisoli TaxID=2895522 RepID=UPI001E46A627|nr:MobP3 family relaxase [Brevibacillus humidisoli]UFJ41346.1 relaxase MobL [Brevibacillus humidisoli]
MSRVASPLVVKIGFYTSTKANTAKNKAHVNYIATRPGAVKEVEPLYEDFIDPGTAVGHIKYAQERPGSHGLFGPTEETHLDDIKKELGKHQGVVWRLIVSLREEDAKRLDMTTRRQWEQKLRAALPDVADKMGIPLSNLRWCAAFHKEPGHPHVHVMLWEKEPKRTRGKLSHAERKDVRRTLAKEIYAEERLHLSREKTAERDLVREMVKEDVDKILSLRQDLQQHREDVVLELKMTGQGGKEIAPGAPTALARELQLRLDALAQQMPTRGRIVFKFMPEEVKQKVMDMADWVLQQPGVKQHVRNYLQAHEGLARIHVLHPDKRKEAQKSAYEDLQKRVSQVLLKAAADIDRGRNQEQEESLQVVHDPVHTISASVSVSQFVFGSIFRTIQRERDKAEAKAAWKQRKNGRKRKRSKERGI